jgi:hypothetical protein
MRDRPAWIQAVPSAPGAAAVLERAAASDDDWRHRGIGRKRRVRGKRRVGRHRRQRRMPFGLARFVIVLTGATVRSPIAPIGIASAVFALAPFKVFSVRWGAFVAEFFESVRGGPERSDAARSASTRRRSIRPSRIITPSGNRPGGNSHLKFDHIFVKSRLQLCQDWGKTGLRQLRKLPIPSRNYPSSSSRCGISGASAGGIG